MTFNEELNKEMREAIAHPEAYKVGVKDGYDDAIEKACDYLYEWNRSQAMSHNARDVLGVTEYTIDVASFRKVMEEE